MFTLQAVLIGLIVILFSNFLFLRAANPQVQLRASCLTNNVFKSSLLLQFGEVPISFMVQGKNLIIFYANRKTGTWTLGRVIPTFPNITCTVMSGHGYIEDKENEINHI